MTTLFSLKKHRRLLLGLKKKIEKKRASLSHEDRARIDNLLHEWTNAVEEQNYKQANLYANKCLFFTKQLLQKSWSEKAREISRSLLFSLVAAFLIRQFWVEFYQVPTGSMRPAILEKDRIIVSKSTFGLKIPFKEKILLPSVENLKRNRMVVFTAANTNIPNSDTSYFYFFKGKKRYVKRCVGKPGDTLYFYGGKIYGINSTGKDIIELRSDTELKTFFPTPIYRIPFLSFEGHVVRQKQQDSSLEFFFKQADQPLGRLVLNPKGNSSKGYFLNKGLWQFDHPEASNYSLKQPTSFCQLWGMENYGTVRILTAEQTHLLHPKKFEQAKQATAYAEIRHHANLSYPYPCLSRIQCFSGITQPLLSPMTTIIPLLPKHLDVIKSGLTTSRFVVKKGCAFLSRNGNITHNPFFISLPKIPDGCYELEKGVPFQVFVGGIRQRLSMLHPLNHLTDAEVILLFNCGTMFSPLHMPSSSDPLYTPPRFAFFYQQNLFLGDIPVFTKGDKILIDFCKQEIQDAETEPHPYLPFIDRGEPLLADGSLDKDFIKNFGMHVPKDSVFVLGDNHAMSSDSRDFGFVPVSSLIGSPIVCFWPPQRFRLLFPLTDFSKGTASLIVRGLACGAFLFIFLKRKRSSKN